MNALNCSAVYLLECNQPLTGSFCLTSRILAQEKLNKLERVHYFHSHLWKQIVFHVKSQGDWEEQDWKSEQNVHFSWALLYSMLTYCMAQSCWPLGMCFCHSEEMENVVNTHYPRSTHQHELICAWWARRSNVWYFKHKYDMEMVWLDKAWKQTLQCLVSRVITPICWCSFVHRASYSLTMVIPRTVAKRKTLSLWVSGVTSLCAYLKLI